MRQRFCEVVVLTLLTFTARADVNTLMMKGVTTMQDELVDSLVGKFLGAVLRAWPHGRAQTESGVHPRLLHTTIKNSLVSGFASAPSKERKSCIPSRRHPFVSHKAPCVHSATAVGEASDAHIPVELGSFRVEQLSESPRVLVLRNFVTPEVCDAITQEAESAGYSASPVAYAGWSVDYSDDLRTWMKGPAVWASLLAVLAANNGLLFTNLVAGDGLVPRTTLSAISIATYAAASAIGAALAYAKADSTRQKLAANRTSLSVTLDPTSCQGAEAYVQAAERLFACHRRFFERPTTIKYRPGDRLAPHFDANAAALNEDKDRGGQTLATLLLYVTNPDANEIGGQTRFGRLGIDVKPRQGDAVLFFPALADGTFDERTEHEGVAPQASEKVIARIWRHMYDVPPPMGLAPTGNS